MWIFVESAELYDHWIFIVDKAMVPLIGFIGLTMILGVAYLDNRPQPKPDWKEKHRP